MSQVLNHDKPGSLSARQPSVLASYSPGVRVKIKIAGREIEADVSAVHLSRNGSTLLVEYECAWIVGEQIASATFREQDLEVCDPTCEHIGFK
jgi:hypothetical protein